MSAARPGDVPLHDLDDTAALTETGDVLADPVAIEESREADAARAGGDVVRGVEAVRVLRSGPAPPETG